MITKILLIGMLVLAIALCVIHMMPKKLRKRMINFRIAAIGIFVAIQIIFSVVHFVGRFIYTQSVQEINSEIEANEIKIAEMKEEIKQIEDTNESSSAQEFESTKVQEGIIRELKEKNYELIGKRTSRQAMDDLFIWEED